MKTNTHKGVTKMQTKQYTKDKTNRLSFRVNESLYNWVCNRAQALGCSPCDYARSIIFQQMSAEETLKAIDLKGKANNAVAEIARSGNANTKKHK